MTPKTIPDASQRAPRCSPDVSSYYYHCYYCYYYYYHYYYYYYCYCYCYYYYYHYPRDSQGWLCTRASRVGPCYVFIHVQVKIHVGVPRHE
jgi:hypothetical protein